MSIFKKILLEIPIIFILFIVSILGVSVIFKPDISDVQKALISTTILFIMVPAAHLAIWKKGFLTTSDRISSFLISSILGIFIYSSLNVLALILFWSGQFTLGLLVGALSKLIGVFSGLFFCNYHLAKTAKRNDMAEKEEAIIRSRTISSKCPDCGNEYTNFNYREGAKDWFCSKCKAKLPKI